MKEHTDVDGMNRHSKNTSSALVLRKVTKPMNKHSFKLRPRVLQLGASHLPNKSSRLCKIEELKNKMTHNGWLVRETCSLPDLKKAHEDIQLDLDPNPVNAILCSINSLFD